MTEDEAKTKWCPFVRMSSVSRFERASNRTDTDLPIGRCIASACVAWRWEKELANRDALEKAANMMAVGSGYHRIEPDFKNTEHGYCGLAGKP